MAQLPIATPRNVMQREGSADGMAMVFDEIRRSYAPWHPEWARLARAAQAGSLLPTPPRKRWRATDV